MGQLIKQFGKIKVDLPIPHLLTMQIDSFKKFLQEGCSEEERVADAGLQGVYNSVFPIEDYNHTAALEFVKYTIGEPKYDQTECIVKGLTYEAPIYLTVRLILYDVVDNDYANRTVREVKEQEIYFGTLPMMTEKGTFIINGTERVIVNQLQRSPGIIFTHDNGKTHSSHKRLYSCRIIPMLGSWLDFEFDHKDVLYVRLDRRRKMPVTILLKAMGMTSDEILKEFYVIENFFLEDDKVYREFNPKLQSKETAYADILDKDGKVILERGKSMTKKFLRDAEKRGVSRIEVDPRILLEQYVAYDIVDPTNGDVIVKAATKLSDLSVEACRDAGIKKITCLHTRGTGVSSSICETLALDKTTSREKAQEEIYRRVRPAAPQTPEVAELYFNNIFRDQNYYDLSYVGRYKLNHRLNIDEPFDTRTLTDRDILTAIKLLLKLKDFNGPSDDIDHLGNRRVRLVGELVENQYRIGLRRMERAIKERMGIQDLATLMPHDLINPKPVTAVLKEFFGTSQLSQFMDQTNSLSEVTHKRRLSALGPGGLTRDRAGFEVRDVHVSHYGRICPIETPEGPNIGLIVSLTTFAKVNDYGFIETPYKIVENGQLTGQLEYFDASKESHRDEEGEEKFEVIAPANTPVGADGKIIDEHVTVRMGDDVITADSKDVTLMDVSPCQMVSISAALIPFLEHDDANRALMGSNMQRQAVPLLRSERAIVGTGMEEEVAHDSGACIVAEGDGVVRYADAEQIIVAYDNENLYPKTAGVRPYTLLKYHKSNQNSCFGQVTICKKGQRFKKGDVLADGPAISEGELALGKNLVVAFMPWCGYNYEDSVLMSERIVKDDIYTSIHIEEFEVVTRDTKLGPEEFTRDISNVSEDMLKDLDECGIIRVGAHVKPEDILVGKITPKGESQLTPEEKLLRAIFGDKARDVKNSSLKVPPGIEGIVIDVKVLNRRSNEKDERTKNIEKMEIKRLDEKEQDYINAVTAGVREKLEDVVVDQVLSQPILSSGGRAIVLPAKAKMTKEALNTIPLKQLDGVFSKKVNEKITAILNEYDEQISYINKIYDLKREKATEGDDLPPGVIEMVKVYIAMKRKLSVGDKMAGRHGNKGVVSMILPEEDMPFFADGRSVDVVLNPLGVPSRMNIGQIMETHLGWAAKELGRQFAEMVDNGVAMTILRDEVKEAFNSPDISTLIDEMDDEEFRQSVLSLRRGIHTHTPVFDGADENDIWNWLRHANKLKLGVDNNDPNDGKSILYDGRTGEPFKNRVTTGVMYYLKLHHLVDEKIHARSTGPYSLVTQQPLGGKAQFGGQRLGEMEVWALEAYGASYLLQEFLTVKSDDVTGRVKMYEKIVKGDNFLEAGLPESFNVLVKELMSLGLNVTLHEEEDDIKTKRIVFMEDVKFNQSTIEPLAN